MVTPIRNKIAVNVFDKAFNQKAITEIFQKLKLSPVNDGVFNGRWGGSGPLVDAVDPATNEPFAKIRTVNFFLSIHFTLCRALLLNLNRLLKR